ncbi:hypothetical protein LOD99_10125 [Oopsacas minuta]|uniref:PH domain-containing protein n=1 Tax=Oopsacas minuta TaxID=111878 RepID=A0AAV7KIH5_9METZ|nr:hypothetical protein LOD99_10125 [Oopsacas minuta]
MSTDTGVTKSNSLPPLLYHSSLIKSGWCLKESGSTFMGSKNWRRRFFRLTEFHGYISLSYFKSCSDELPAGIIPLDRTYTTRIIELAAKGKLHCFAVGPLIDDGSSRTYYVCCLSDLEKKEWMAAIEAAIEGVPQDAMRRVKTLRSRNMSRRAARPTPGGEEDPLTIVTDNEPSDPNGVDTEEFDRQMSEMLGVKSSELSLPSPTLNKKFSLPPLSSLDIDPILLDTPDSNPQSSTDDEDDLDFETCTGSVYDCINKPLSIDLTSLEDYRSSRWRIDQWLSMKHKVESTSWKKVDTSHEITLARTKFSSEYPVLIKLEGKLEADPQIALEYFKNAIKVGGNFDHPFRNEIILEYIPEEPEAVVIQNYYHVPIPHMDKRELTALRYWVPSYMDTDNCSGMVVTRMNHPQAVKISDVEKILLSPSGLILRPHFEPSGELHTYCTVFVQINVRGSLQRMFKTAYNSGLLKLGLRSVFGQIKQHVEMFVRAMSL